tara:strand:- start:280 stop:510 length:231 start_codon:yes stop_codon:yes gene_type:complete
VLLLTLLVGVVCLTCVDLLVIVVGLLVIVVGLITLVFCLLILELLFTLVLLTGVEFTLVYFDSLLTGATYVDLGCL